MRLVADSQGTTSRKAKPTHTPDGRRNYFEIGGFDAYCPPHFPQEPQELQDSKDSHDHQDLDDSKERKEPQDLKDSKDWETRADPCGPPPDSLNADCLDQPLEVYVRNALDFAKLERNSESAERWRSPLFSFTRLVKGHPLLKDLTSHAAMYRVGLAMTSWSDLPKGSDPWLFHFPDPCNAEEARIDFMHSWDAVHSSPFDDFLAMAQRSAKEKPLKPPCERGGLYPHFISLAGWLQFYRGDRTIMLPTRKIAPLIDCQPRSVSSLRKFAMTDGLLKLVKPSRFSSKAPSKATEFRFAVEKFEVLRKSE